MNRLLLKLFTGLAICGATSFAAPFDAKSALSEASAGDQFLFLTFYKVKDASLTSMTSTIAAFKKSSSKKIALFDAAIDNPVNKEIADKYGIYAGQLPLLLVIAPNGVVTGGFPANVTADQLKQSVSISELMLKVLKPLQEQKVVLVALQNSATKLNTESWAGVVDITNDTDYKQQVSAVKADPAAAGSQDFIKQCQLIAPLTEATVVVLLPPGKIGTVLSGKTTKADILKALHECTAGSSCCPSDSRYKQDITPIDSALEKITQLHGVTFRWNQREYPRRFFSNDPQIGLIAQDVEAIIPEVVLTDKDGFKSVTYDKLTAVLIEAVKEMKKKIDIQDSLLQAQNIRIRALEGN
jgi:hypothetical protein